MEPTAPGRRKPNEPTISPEIEQASKERAQEFPEIDAHLQELGAAQQQLEEIAKRISRLPSAQNIEDQWNEIFAETERMVLDNTPLVGQLRKLMMDVYWATTGTQFTAPAYKPRSLKDVRRAAEDYWTIRNEGMQHGDLVGKEQALEIQVADLRTTVDELIAELEETQQKRLLDISLRMTQS